MDESTPVHPIQMWVALVELSRPKRGGDMKLEGIRGTFGRCRREEDVNTIKICGVHARNSEEQTAWVGGGGSGTVEQCKNNFRN